MFKTTRLMGMVVAALLIGAPAAFAATDMGPADGSTVGHWVTQDRINVNTATVQQLERVPGISASTAQAIVAYRDQNGPFMDLDQLQFVHGIFPQDIDQLGNYLVTGNF